MGFVHPTLQSFDKALPYQENLKGSTEWTRLFLFGSDEKLDIHVYNSYIHTYIYITD